MTAARCTNLISRYHGDSHWRRASMIIAVMGRSALRAAIDLATAAIEHFGAELGFLLLARVRRSEEHTSELQSLMRISYAVFCLKKTKKKERTKNSKKY